MLAELKRREKELKKIFPGYEGGPILLTTRESLKTEETQERIRTITEACGGVKPRLYEIDSAGEPVRIDEADI